MKPELRWRLARSERVAAMAEMTATVAHEMNRPLSALAVYAQAARELAQSGAAAPQLVSALDHVIEQTRRAGLAVERVRRVFQGDAVSLETTDINTLVAEVVELARLDASPHGVMIETAPGADLPRVRCDPVQIRQVLGNLIGNALEALLEIDCRSGSTIHVATRTADRAVHVEVRDCGSGIDPEIVDDMFEAFRSNKKDGLGIGLAISRTIILNHAGNLQGESVVDGDGKPMGASFRFTLPV